MKQPNKTSDLCHLLSIAGALGVGVGVYVGDGNPGGGVLADEVEDVAQRAAHAVFEASAQTHVEQRVEAAVEIRQTQRQHVRQVKSGTVGGMPRGDQ